MKRTLTILLVLSSLYSFADLGYCFKYKSNFTLTNGTTITGYFYWGGFDYENLNLSTLDSILSVNFLSTDSVTVYTELYQLTSLSNMLEGEIEYFATTKDKIKNICKKDIIRTEVIQCEPCCFKKDSEYYQYYAFCSNYVITELSGQEIDSLQNIKPVVSFYLGNCLAERLEDLVVASYSKKMTTEKIESLVLEIFCEQFKYDDMIPDEEKKRRYELQKKQLKKYELIAFRIYYAN
ncbi:MAG: hypothetical protein EOM59_12425 [Clostridia bacterium]|nr:hypothetical protein [Clostridia bacterium]